MTQPKQPYGMNGAINWTTLLSACGLAILLVGAFWSIVQVQFAAHAALILDVRHERETLGTLMQAQIDRRFLEVERRLEGLEKRR